MKKIAENRYPNSATLFKFCKEALAIRYEGNVKVIDQDVGAILGYDPADCSHWKKGKKNIRALSTLRAIADHLAIDDRLLIEIAAGKVGFDEAVFEFRGYGSFALNGRTGENLKKEFLKSYSTLTVRVFISPSNPFLPLENSRKRRFTSQKFVIYFQILESCQTTQSQPQSTLSLRAKVQTFA